MAALRRITAASALNFCIVSANFAEVSVTPVAQACLSLNKVCHAWRLFRFDKFSGGSLIFCMPDGRVTVGGLTSFPGEVDDSILLS